MKAEIISEIKRLSGGGEVFENEILAGHTTFKTGGAADVFVSPCGEDSIIGLISFLRKEDIPFFVLGNGSNVLIGDKGFRGVVILLGSNHGRITVDREKAFVEAESGAGLIKTARLAGEAGLSGMEFASGIPGTIGGAVVMNAGAYGGEMKQIISYASVYDMESGKTLRLDREGLKLSYRDSIIKHAPLIVLKAGLELSVCEGGKEEIAERMEELRLKRVEKQPLEYPSAGSTFKRPEGYFAGKLIEDSGLRGYTVGGAQVSERHCGFVINRGGASASDIRRLIEDVQRIVFEKQGVKLETEVLMIGEFA